MTRPQQDSGNAMPDIRPDEVWIAVKKDELFAEECVYCQEPKRVKIWQETDELVCLDCRQSLLEQEFNDAF